MADYPTLFSGVDMAYYEGRIREAVEQRNSDGGGSLMSYFDEKRNPGVKAKVVSAVPSVEIRDGELKGCTTVQLKENLTSEEMKELQRFLQSEFSDGWGEGLEQQDIQTGDGVLYVHFGEEPFIFAVEQMQPTGAAKEQPAIKRPKMKLVGQAGNIFAILGRASRLLRENGQPDQAKEMGRRVYQSDDYYKALNIISEYVETELSERTSQKQKKRSSMER